jgi:hypothetical protein
MGRQNGRERAARVVIGGVSDFCSIVFQGPTEGHLKMEAGLKARCITLDPL